VPERAFGAGSELDARGGVPRERGPTPGNLARAVPLWTGHGRDDGWDLWNDASLEASKGLSDLEQKQGIPSFSLERRSLRATRGSQPTERAQSAPRKHSCQRCRRPHRAVTSGASN